MSEEPAQAVGSLEATPFVDLLVHAFDHRLTGTLVLEEPSGSRHGIYFEGGTPRKAKTAGAVAPLGELLVETGVISEDVHQSTLARALDEHLLHGQVLVGDGLISEQALAFGLREQLLRQMLWLFERPQGTRFGYFHGSNFLEDWGAEPIARISVMELLWRGLRDHARPEEIRAVLTRLVDRPIVLREDMPLDYFYFMGSDRDVVELLRHRPQRLVELHETAPALGDVIERVVCLLLLSRSIDLGTRTAPPLGVEANVDASPWTLPRASAPVSAAPPRPDLADESPAVSTPIPVMEADVDAYDPEEERVAEQALEFSAEPDVTEASALPVDEAAEPPADVDESTEIVEAAAPRAVLDAAPTPPEDEADIEVVEPSGTEASRSERALAASAAFERAERLLAGGHFERAEVEARTAVENEPGQAEYVALAAWIAALKPGADVSRVTLELKRALRLAENNVKVHWYRGLVLQHLGRHEIALREFRTVLDLDPRHIDAARQVRVYEMRLEQSPKGRPSLAPEPPPATRGWLWRKR